MVRKGVSAEEKSHRLLAIYHTTKRVFNLKEIEKAGAKQGIVINTIKDVNQALVDDQLVDNDKIGASNYFWSFPSKLAVARRNRVDLLKQDIIKEEGKVAVNKRKIEELQAQRVDTVQRKNKLQRLEEDTQR
ncbi:unnamed protein product [Choristocarpus tenellus]